MLDTTETVFSSSWPYCKIHLDNYELSLDSSSCKIPPLLKVHALYHIPNQMFYAPS